MQPMQRILHSIEANGQRFSWWMKRFKFDCVPSIYYCGLLPKHIWASGERSSASDRRWLPREVRNTDSASV